MIYHLKNTLGKYIFRPFFILIGTGFLFHLAWALISEHKKEIEIKTSVIKSLQDPFRKNAYLDIKNIVTGHNLPGLNTLICIKLKDGLVLTEGNCHNVQYEKAPIDMIEDYFYIAVDRKFDWSFFLSYLIIFAIGVLIFHLSKRKLNAFTKSIISDVNQINTSTAPFHYQELESLAYEVKKGQEAMLKAEEAKQKEKFWQMATRFAHDSKWPLSIIKNAEKVEKNIFDHAVHGLEALITDLLQLYKNPLMENTPSHKIDIAQVAKSCIPAINALYPEVSVNFTGKPILVNISKQDLERIINNLLKNACEAKSSQINISTHNRVLSVQDDGVGIHSNIAENIFDEKKISSKAHGHGLGLPIVKKLLTQYGASVGIHSQGQGATITLSFPLFKADRPFVLVEDNAIIRECWEKEAENSGHALTAYPSYEQLFENLNRHNLNDIFFCDISTAEGNKAGIRGSRRLHELGFKNIYLATGYQGIFSHKDCPWVLDILSKDYPLAS